MKHRTFDDILVELKDIGLKIGELTEDEKRNLKIRIESSLVKEQEFQENHEEIKRGYKELAFWVKTYRHIEEFQPLIEAARKANEKFDWYLMAF